MKKEAAKAACELVGLTNEAAINHLLSQVEWWYVLIGVAIILVVILLMRSTARKTGFATGAESGTGLLRQLTVDARYEMCKIPVGHAVCLLKDLDSDEVRFYMLDASEVVGGQVAISNASTFQTVATHGGDQFQLCKLEVVAAADSPKLRERVAKKVLFWRSKGEAAETANA